ncbi:hypothetical protein [uncultured Stenotrophomonas sp.]|uniref:hypothetical protein n=1 Tax=uncultured Stenotrophomonas sp. TaxID=165438 RepID=UPI0025851F75|nr:hypothetical protein [uncultured Stenotrophomonas sp.]
MPTKVGTYQSNTEVFPPGQVSTLVDTVLARAAGTSVPTKVGTYQSNTKVFPPG